MDELSAFLLKHYGQEQFTPGLSRIEKVIGPLKEAFKDTKIITIAGTNGKGETTLRLSKLLGDDSHCVWTSPHIERITERFRSEEGEMSHPDLAHLIEQCHREKPQLSYYEFLFYVFCTWAAQRKPKYLLLEVGLGGRLDAVNAFDAHLVLLPSISRDHQEFLGRRYDQILKEKLGVLRPGARLIHYLHLNYLKERATQFAQDLKAQVSELESLKSLPEDHFSARNQFLAYAAYAALKNQQLNPKEWRPGHDFLEHRGEILTRGAEWTFFGSHNIDGLRKLILFLIPESYTYDAVIVAFSHRDPRDLGIMLRMVKAMNKHVKVTCFDHPKAASKEVMEDLALQEGLDFVNDIDSYVQEKGSGRYLVTGSYYLLGHIKSCLRR